MSESQALKKAYQLTGKAQPPIQQLLNKADLICKAYFKEQNLEHLVIGTGAVK